MKKLLFAGMGIIALSMLTCQIENLHELTEYKQVVARFEHSADGCSAPCLITFENRSTNGAFFLWDFGDGATSTEINPVHEYDRSGNYLVRLTAFEQNGRRSARDSAFININFLVDFEIQNELCTGPCTISFKNLSDPAAQYEWDFGDGSISTETNPTHQFQGGSYTVTLTARTDTGDAFSKTKTATIRFVTFEKRIIASSQKSPIKIYQLEDHSYLIFGNVFFDQKTTAFFSTFSENGAELLTTEDRRGNGLGINRYSATEFYYTLNTPSGSGQSKTPGNIIVGVTNPSGALLETNIGLVSYFSTPADRFTILQAIPIISGSYGIEVGLIGRKTAVELSVDGDIEGCMENYSSMVGRFTFKVRDRQVYCLGLLDVLGRGGINLRKIILTPDGDLVAVGEEVQSDVEQVIAPYFVRLNADGEGYDRLINVGRSTLINDILLTEDGGFIIAGRGEDFLMPDKMSYFSLIKTDPSGNLEWHKTYGEDLGFSVERAQATSVKQTPDGGYIVAGDAGSTIILAKTDGAGNVEWNRHFPGIYDRKCTEVIPTSDGGYMILGTVGDVLPGGVSISDLLLIKTDANGNVD